MAGGARNPIVRFIALDLEAKHVLATEHDIDGMVSNLLEEVSARPFSGIKPVMQLDYDELRFAHPLRVTAEQCLFATLYIYFHDKELAVSALYNIRNSPRVNISDPFGYSKRSRTCIGVPNLERGVAVPDCASKNIDGRKTFSIPAKHSDVLLVRLNRVDPSVRVLG